MASIITPDREEREDRRGGGEGRAYLEFRKPFKAQSRDGRYATVHEIDILSERACEDFFSASVIGGRDPTGYP